MTDTTNDKDIEIANLKRLLTIATLKQNPAIAQNSHSDLYAQLFPYNDPSYDIAGNISMRCGETLADAVANIKATKPHYFPPPVDDSPISKTGYKLNDLKALRDPRKLLEIARLGGKK